MNNKFAFFILLILGSGSFFYVLSQQTDQEKWKQEEMENYLRKARVVSVRKSPQAGRTAPWRVLLDDGKKQRQGHFKHINRPRPAILANSYKYEIAAYELDKLLELNIVPPVVEREIEGTKGSLQLFLEGCIKEEQRKRRKLEPPDPESFQNSLEVVNIFENLVHEEECFDSGDILIHLEDWKVCRVDFDMAFSPVPELIPGCRISRCSKKLYEKLLVLDREHVKTKLKPYLNDEEIEALIQRKNIIIEKLQKLIKEKGEEAVLFS